MSKQPKTVTAEQVEAKRAAYKNAARKLDEQQAQWYAVRKTLRADCRAALKEYTAAIRAEK